jgi:hypothetical protein
MRLCAGKTTDSLAIENNQQFAARRGEGKDRGLFATQDLKNQSMNWSLKPLWRESKSAKLAAAINRRRQILL